MTTKKYTKEVLEPVVRESRSVTDVIRRLGKNVSGGMHYHIKQYIDFYKLDTSHFTGQLWSKGLVAGQHKSIKQLPDSDIFTNKRIVRRPIVRKRFKRVSVYQCSICQNEPTWHDKPLALHLDHINGDNLDNRKQNLRWLC